MVPLCVMLRGVNATSSWIGGVWVGVILAVGAMPAAAEDGAQASVATPWSVGVTDEQKASAQALLDEGNDLYIQNRYRDAADKYRAALAAWNHPAIRFNLVKALVSLDEPIEAAAELELAVAYGDAPFEADVLAEVRNYQRLLAAQIAKVEVTCEQPGVSATFNGEPVACPGTSRHTVRPGRHTISGQGDGLLTQSRVETLVAGDNPTIELRLVAIADATITRTRWAAWKPWVVVGGGAATLGLGTVLALSARSLQDDYREALRTECGELGCAPGEVPDSLQALEGSYRFRDRLSIGLLATGGAALAAGVTLLILNRAYTVVPEQETAPSVALAPWVEPGGGGLSVSWTR